MRYAVGIDERGQPIAIRDPLQGTLSKIAARYEEGRSACGHGLRFQRFRSKSAGKLGVRRRGHLGYRSLMQHGTLVTVAKLIND